MIMINQKNLHTLIILILTININRIVQNEFLMMNLNILKIYHLLSSLLTTITQRRTAFARKMVINENWKNQINMHFLQ